MTQRNGFTLLELMLATVLMSVLMIGVLAVLTQVLRSPQMTSDQGEPMGEVGPSWVELIRHDLTQARTVEHSANRIKLMGYVWLDPVTGQRTQQPAHVTYRLVEIGERPWMVRTSQMIDRDKQPTVRHELLGSGVTRFELVGQNVTRGLPNELPKDTVWDLRFWIDDQRDPAVHNRLVMNGGISG